MYQEESWLSLILGLRKHTLHRRRCEDPALIFQVYLLKIGAGDEAISGETMYFSEYVKIREEKFGTVIFDTLREKVFITNESGKDIVHLLEEGQSIDKIVDVLADTYGLESAQIREDVISFISQLKDNSIVAV